MLLRYLDP
ncbi:hypothetical protein D037_0075A, partial [Vibrio parahaemolyticus IDH02640]